MYEDIIKGIALGAFYGAQAALIGYLKSDELEQSWRVVLTKKFWESFEPTKAIKTIVVGAAMGGFTQGQIYGIIPADPIVSNFGYDIIVMGVDQFVKFIVRRTPLVRLWNALKEKVLKLPVQ